nr:unnamed protein product [Spirometra erinaceieuropaei]
MVSLDISEPCETITKQPHLLSPRPFPLSPCTSPHRVHDDNRQTAGKHTHDAPPPPITTAIIPATTPAKATKFPTPATGENATNASLTTTLTITAPTASNVDSFPTCPHCERTLTLRIGLVDHLRIRRTETGELVPLEPT